jgi:TPR repeat protein
MSEFDSIGRFGLLVDEIAETMLGLLQQIIRRRARAVHRPIAGRPHLQPGTTPAGVQSMRKSAQIGLCAIVLALAGVTAAAAQSLWLSPGGPGIVRLAERGDARAQTRIGFMYATGQRVPQNPIEAAYWYRRAAEQGDINAQYLLGVCYDNGRGVPRDLVQGAGAQMDESLGLPLNGRRAGASSQNARHYWGQDVVPTDRTSARPRAHMAPPAGALSRPLKVARQRSAGYQLL